MRNPIKGNIVLLLVLMNIYRYKTSTCVQCIMAGKRQELYGQEFTSSTVISGVRSYPKDQYWIPYSFWFINDLADGSLIMYKIISY